MQRAHSAFLFGKSYVFHMTDFHERERNQSQLVATESFLQAGKGATYKHGQKKQGPKEWKMKVLIWLQSRGVINLPVSRG